MNLNELSDRAYNETVPMTRRYPDLMCKQLERDSKIAVKIIRAHDVEHDLEAVLDLWRKYHNLLSNPRYWEILKTIWVSAGSTPVSGEFRRYMQSSRPCRNYFMTPEEHEALRGMSFPMKIYRGCNGKNDDGISWTTNIEVAVDFATRGKKRKSCAGRSSGKTCSHISTGVGRMR